MTILDEAAFKLAVTERLPSDFVFAPLYSPEIGFQEYLAVLDEYERGVNLQPGRVATTSLYGFVGGEIAGRVSLRHELNDALLVLGGHIGYGVLAEQRRKGFATEMLRQALPYARALGLTRVLVTCDDANIASYKVIEACGGVLENVVLAGEDGAPTRRYWIELS